MTTKRSHLVALVADAVEDDVRNRTEDFTRRMWNLIEHLPDANGIWSEGISEYHRRHLPRPWWKRIWSKPLESWR
jgi:hypothetical protein